VAKKSHARKKPKSRKPARKPARKPRKLGPSVEPPSELPIAKPDVTLKLDLACGRHCRPDFEGVDVVLLIGAPIMGADGKPTGEKHPDVKHVVDLQSFPWPWADHSVAEIVCSHYVEHIPMYPLIDGKDQFFAFFDELYRVLHPEGFATIIVPSGRSDRAFQDPTHRRFIVETSFAYLSAQWRRDQGLDHYVAKCNFGAQVNQIVDTALNAMHPEAAGRQIRNYWNTTIDLHARLKPFPPLPPEDAPPADPAT
jgi:hypothetical protein